MKRISGIVRAGVLATVFSAIAASPGLAQQPAAEPPKPAAKEETPFWAIGMPKNEVASKMAPVAALPIPTPADKLPVKKIKVPPGFKVEVWAGDILDARGMRQGDKGTVFVSLALRRRQALRGRRQGRQARGQDDRREALPAERHRVPQGRALRRHAEGHHALRQHRGEPRQPAEAGDGVRQAAGRRAARLEVHQDRARQQALLPGRRAVQHLRSVGQVPADLPHEPRRHRRSSRW